MTRRWGGGDFNLGLLKSVFLNNILMLLFWRGLGSSVSSKRSRNDMLPKFVL
jgi:hypothetical protein